VGHPGEELTHGGQLLALHEGLPLPLELLLRPPAPAPHLGLAQLSLDGGDEACQVALHDVVLRAHLHRSHRRVLADGAGHEDEREVEPRSFSSANAAVPLKCGML